MPFLSLDRREYRHITHHVTREMRVIAERSKVGGKKGDRNLLLIS